jgi:hypothetical protein
MNKSYSRASHLGSPSRCLLYLCFISLTATLPAQQVKLLRTPDNGIQPQPAVDSKGVVHLIYFKGDPKGGDLFYVRRVPGDQQFSKPIPVNSKPGTAMALGTIRGAHLAAGKNGRVHVAWDGMGASALASHANHGHGPGHAGHKRPNHGDEKHPLLYTRLNDAGTAFEPERNIITSAYGLDGGSSVAADPEGNVYVVWHAPRPGTSNTNGDAGRGVFVARSEDEGKSFAREKLATDKPTGACACCGLRAFADKSGSVFILFRAAEQNVNRDEMLLFSHNHGADFQTAYSHGWKITTCPMSSAFLSETSSGVLAAAETHGRVFFVQFDPKTGNTSKPLSPEAKGKHPVAISNNKGETLLVWTEGAGWGQPGQMVFQLYDAQGKPTEKAGGKDGVPAWSFATAFLTSDETFEIVF